MKRLTYYFKGYIKETIFGPLFKLLEASFELLVPIVIAKMIDETIPRGDRSSLLLQIGLIFFLAAVGVVVAITAQYYSSKAAVGYTRQLTEDLYQKVMSLGKKDRDELGTASLITRLTADTFQIQTGLNQFLRLFLRAPIIVFGAIIMAFSISPSLTIWFLVMVVTLFIIVFGYNKSKPLLNGINLHIPAGAKVAIVGPTGAGKSTLINLLMRFYEVDGGNILLDGKPITDYEPSQLRQEIGMVLQETWLKSATIHDNIAYANPKASREEVIEAAKAANADFFIKQLPNGYDTYLEDAGDSLSQGQCQLLTIARIFLKLPRILILDEATSSIDTRTEVLVQEAFQMLMKGRTSFIIAHRLSTIQTADIILVMVSGEIVEVGNHSELMAQKGIYYQMQNAQK